MVNTRTILAVWNSANKGKTESLREFAHVILSTYPSVKIIFPVPFSIPPKGDFRLVVDIGDKIVAVETQGDPNTKLEERLVDLADNFHCDVILCSARTRGDTVLAVDDLFHTRGFQTIWTSTYQIAIKDSILR